ncbi:hypothetical protein F4604DRAFT_1757412 [Suillus subluteus]|nr:hypothetical protein F4604DRAFT_1757412 [Suillus subluteus]
MQQPVFLHLTNLLHFTSCTNAVPRVQPRKPLDLGHKCFNYPKFFTVDSTMEPQVPVTLPLPSSLSGQAAPRFYRFGIGSPPRLSDAPVMQFLRQHLSFLVPRHSHVPPVVDVTSGRKTTVTHISLHLGAFC